MNRIIRLPAHFAWGAAISAFTSGGADLEAAVHWQAYKNRGSAAPALLDRFPDEVKEVCRYVGLERQGENCASVFSPALILAGAAVGLAIVLAVLVVFAVLMPIFNHLVW